VQKGIPRFSRACGSANRASGPPAIAIATPGVDGRRLRNGGGNPIKRRDVAPECDVWGHNGVAFGRREGEKDRPKSTVCPKGIALSICPLNHPLSAATPMRSPGTQQRVCPCFSASRLVSDNNLEMAPRDEIFNASLKAKYFGLGYCLNHLDSTWREINSRILV